MQTTSRFIKLPIILWGAIAVVGWLARQPVLPDIERSEIAHRFQFDKSTFPAAEGPFRTRGAVNPRLERIAAWISSVGAGVALGDLDGDGLSNDACLVDPRTDTVMVTPVPGTGARFRSFVLNPNPLPFDSASMAPMGCLIADLNEDGLRDLVVYYWGRTPVAFLRRAGSTALSPESFTAQELVPGGERWYTNAGLAADLDGDGHADLIFGNYFPDGSVVLGPSGPATMHASMSHASNGGSKPVLLWKSASAGPNPEVKFARVADVAADLGTGWTLAIAACDIDGDLLPELYIANDFGPDVLLHNLSTPGRLAFQKLHGRRDWATPKSKVLGQDSFKGMGVDCADLNGDGIPDLIVSNITDTYALEESNLVFMSTGDLGGLKSGLAPYREQAETLGVARSGWSWDVRLGDFNNDGVPEIVQATGFVRGSTNRWPELQELAMGNDVMLHNPDHWPRLAPGDDLSGENHDRFFVRSRSGRYFDMSSAVGLGDPLITRGIAVADVDGDGRLDFALANQWGDSFFFHNTEAETGAFLGIHLMLAVSAGPTTIQDGHPGRGVAAYPAPGARATVFFPDGRKIVKQADGGNGHSGKSSPDLHFGLGAAGADPLRVVLDWRDRSGTVRHMTARLTPGWHTVLLGSVEQ